VTLDQQNPKDKKLLNCKLTIKDEVNIKVDGLRVETRRKIVNKLKFDLPYARHMPAYKLGRWDGTKTYFNIGGSGYLAHLDVILAVIEDEGYDIEVEDLRPHQELKFAAIDENYWADLGKTWPKGHQQTGEPIVLRDYQYEVINKFLENPQALQEVATGAGKTITTATLSHLCEPYGRTMVVVPNKSLVVQTEEDYRNLGLDVGVYFGDRKEYNKTHTICTWQSLNNLLKNTKAGEAEINIKEFIEDVVCVMVDEVHMAKADALKSLLTGPFSHIPIRWGLTGTVPKSLYEQVSLLVSLGPVIGKLSAAELQEKGVLAQCHVNIIQMKDGVEFSNYQSELKHLLENEKRLDKIAQIIDNIKDSGNTLILVDRVNAGRELVSRLPDSVFISGETKLTERKEEYDEVKTSANKVIVATYGVAAVGINIPRIFNLVLIEPGKSFVRVIQSIGRGIRKAEDKDNVEIWDITSDCKFAKRHLTQRKAYYKEAKYPFSLEKLDY
jgi:superfamily II DNA or RNA helicase